MSAMLVKWENSKYWDFLNLFNIVIYQNINIVSVEGLVDASAANVWN